MGNARWKGVPLKALLAKAGVRSGAVQISFQGLDRPVLPETPTFMQALDLDHALDGGYGVSEVALAAGVGQTWTGAQLGENLGRYSFREWRASVALEPGKHR